MTAKVKPFIDLFKETWEWFDSKTPRKKLSIVFFLIFIFLGYKYIELQHDKDIRTEKDIETLRKQIEDCAELSRTKEQIESELMQVKMNSIMLKASSDYLPFPFWIKDRQGKMIYLNRAYEVKYLHPRNLTAIDYIGFYDNDIWDEDTAKRFKENDSLVLQHNKPMTFYEFDGQRFTKFPVSLGAYVMGIGGVEYVDYK